jgi:hypothetical protein
VIVLKCLVSCVLRQLSASVLKASMEPYKEKVPNSISGECNVEEMAPGGSIKMTCILIALEPDRKKQDRLFFDQDVVVLRPSIAFSAVCNDPCHQTRKEDGIDVIPGRVEVCLGGSEYQFQGGSCLGLKPTSGRKVALQNSSSHTTKWRLSGDQAVFSPNVILFDTGNKGKARIVCGALVA